ncbi:MAG: Na-translocating system protein MpsC family protein, partial [Cyanobacteriota bacterium]|nr:Na-translocating system protein MpsC family protein [Cyanobacteriota bacterium]
RILLQESRSELPQLVRDSIDDALKSHVKTLIEEILKVPTVELLYDTTLETGYTGILAILTRTPQVRNPSAIPKGKLERANDRDRPTRE